MYLGRCVDTLKGDELNLDVLKVLTMLVTASLRLVDLYILWSKFQIFKVPHLERGSGKV